MDVVIRRARPKDEAPWRRLWSAYMRFNEETPTESLARSNWARIMDESSSICGIVAENDRNLVIGIANFVLHESTWAIGPVCYLSDLFVEPSCRRAGVGKLFVDWLIREMRIQGWSRLYWHAKEDNHRARSLYDRYTKHSGCLRYCLSNTSLPVDSSL